MTKTLYHGWVVRWSPARALPWQASKGVDVLFDRTEAGLKARIDSLVPSAPLPKRPRPEVLP